MPKCDICHKYFTTKAQMKQHRIKEHTKKIPGTKFRVPKQSNHQHKIGEGFLRGYVSKEKDALKYCRFEARQMKDEKHPIDGDERRKKRLRIRRTEEEKYEETQKEEKKRIQKDKNIDEEEDEEKEQEEQNEYNEGKDEEKDYEYEEDDERRRRIQSIQ